MSNVSLYNFPAPQEFSNLKELAMIAVSSGFLPASVKTKEQGLIIMLKGRELGIPPMQAFSHIHVINGKPTMSSELMMAQIYKCIPKAIVNFQSTTDKACIIEAQRPHGKMTIFSFTIEEAKKADLLGKKPWQQYPAAMLRARAISIMARALFPDALNGVSYTPEELGVDLDIDDSGEEQIKDVTPPVVEPIEPKVEAVVAEPAEVKDSGKLEALNLGNYKIRVGRFSGKLLCEIKLDDIQRAVEHLKKEKVSAAGIPEAANEFLNKATSYLEAMA